MLDGYAGISRRIAAETGADLCDRRAALLDHRAALLDHRAPNNPDGQTEGIRMTDGAHLNDAGNALVAMESPEALRL